MKKFVAVLMMFLLLCGCDLSPVSSSSGSTSTGASSAVFESTLLADFPPDDTADDGELEYVNVVISADTTSILSQYTAIQLPTQTDDDKIVSPTVFLDSNNLFYSGGTFDSLYRYQVDTKEWIKIVTENVKLPENLGNVNSSNSKNNSVSLSLNGDYEIENAQHFYFTEIVSGTKIEVKDDKIISIIDTDKIKKDTVINYKKIGVEPTSWYWKLSESNIESIDYNPKTQLFVIVTPDWRVFIADKNLKNYEEIPAEHGLAVSAKWLDNDTILIKEYGQMLMTRRDGVWGETCGFIKYDIKTGKSTESQAGKWFYETHSSNCILVVRLNSPMSPNQIVDNKNNRIYCIDYAEEVVAEKEYEIISGQYVGVAVEKDSQTFLNLYDYINKTNVTCFMFEKDENFHYGFSSISPDGNAFIVAKLNNYNDNFDTYTLYYQK